ncbi:MAG: L-threonylcarbamoyladenylate synthase [Bacteroidota bacterium]
MIGTSIPQAIHFLQDEQVVAIPTETVYGLAGNAFSESAVLQIFKVKNRPSFDPLIVHTSHWERAKGWVRDMPEVLAHLAKAFTPGPLTLLLSKKAVIPDLVTSGSPLVAIRVPGHPLTQQLLGQLAFPVAAPSANPFGYISPTTAQHVEQQLGDKIPYILDGGACTVGLESTIVGIENGQVTIFRKGGISVEAIEAQVGKVVVKAHSTSNPKAPGMLKSHYAPRVPLVITTKDTAPLPFVPQLTGAIRFQHLHPAIPAEQQVILSENGGLEEAARRLFAAMRQLDGMALEGIVAELVPEQGLGRAINDRLRRAAVRE